MIDIFKDICEDGKYCLECMKCEKMIANMNDVIYEMEERGD
jgi:hypothetical protein